MSLNIKEIFRSDLDQSSLINWWSSKKLEKLNWNFTEILNSGGGPLGPQGFEGNIGSAGITGNTGEAGFEGSQGFQGVQGQTGYMSWLENSDISKNNSTIKSVQDKTDPSTAIVGLDENENDLNYNEVFSAGNEYSPSFRAHTRVGTSQYNMVFTSDDVDGAETDLSVRQHYCWDLWSDGVDTASELYTEFHNTTDGITRFKVSSVIGSGYELLTPKRSYTSPSTWNNITPTSLLTLNSNLFSPGSGITGFTSNFTGISNTFLDTIKIQGNALGNPNTNYVAHMHPDTVSEFGTGSEGTITWGSPGSVIGAFPIGTVIAIDDDFDSTHFDLNISGTLTSTEITAITGSSTFTPTFKFKYGAGKGKFKGWYLCNGRTWFKGVLAYSVPNLCGFDLSIDYPYTGGTGATINLSPTSFKTILGSSNIDISANFDVNTEDYSISVNSLESWEDSGEPTMSVYRNQSAGFSDLNLSQGAHDGLIYLVYLGDDGFEWDSSGSTTAPTLTDYVLGYSSSSAAAACSASTSTYKANFSTAWGDSGEWKTNGNKLYNSTGTALASIGWYSNGVISRFWNPYYESFRFSDINTASRVACTSYTSINLVYNESVLANAINGTFSSRTKITKYIDTSSLSTASSIYNDTAGTSDASAGWYRDANCRRYWNGGAFIGVTITSDYVHHIDDFGAASSSSTACSAADNYSLYYETSNSDGSSSTFYTVTNVFYSTEITAIPGASYLSYAVSNTYYSNGSVHRRGTNSSTGALSTYTSCTTTAPTPSGGGGGGGGGGCVLFGTKILMEDGTTKPVQEISVGDRLMSKGFIGMPSKEDSSLFKWNSKDLKLQQENVSVVSSRTFNVNVIYSFNDGKMFTSEDHLHLFKNGGYWKVGKTRDVKIGDYLLGYDGTEILVSNIIETRGQFLVYRLDVEDNDLFVANGILTHNLKEDITDSDGSNTPTN
jgi:hypothetical protein